MNDSILKSVKNILGISEDVTDFDATLILHINSVLFSINQISDKLTKFSIKDSSDKWADYLKEYDDLEAVKTYVALKVKMIFDPPASSIASEATKNVISELEFRINIYEEGETNA